MGLVIFWAVGVAMVTLLTAAQSDYDRARNTVGAFVLSSIVGGLVIVMLIGAILTDGGVGYTQESRVERLSERGVYFDGEQYSFLIDDQVVSASENDVTVIPDDRNEVLVKEYIDSDWSPWLKDTEYVLYIPAGTLKTAE